MSEKVLFDTYFFSFFDNGTMGHCDGIGYCGETSREDVYKLYLVLKEYFENNTGNKDG